VKLLSFLFVFLFTFHDADFLSKQKKNIRVKSAFNEKFQGLKKDLKKINIDIEELNLIFVALKEEKRIELYVKNEADKVFKKFRSYSICESSGVLGPKREEGDLQVPEGFYHINHFNPASNFWLSLGINYPNKSDKIKSGAKKPGGSIYIHGDCVTIGCMPLTDDKIKEVYVLACQAKNTGQVDIPVYIFPYEMSNSNHNLMKMKYKSNKGLIEFWNRLKTGYDKYFESLNKINFSVDSKGNYIFQ
jgi:murein L,D-transpeptidase YafK